MDLECDHCGGRAFTTTDIRDGVACATCGMPGSVVVDVFWQSNSNGRCEDLECPDCGNALALTRARGALG